MDIPSKTLTITETNVEPLSFSLRVLRLLLLIAGGTGLLALAGCAFYRTSLFPAERATLAEADRQACARGLQLWPVAGPDYRALVTAHPPAMARGVVVVFHGNAGTAAHRIYYPEALEPLGWRVVLAEYPGYGARAGRPDEHTLISDGAETARQAVQAFGGPLILWGESLGAAVAAGVAAQPDVPAAGLVLLTPWCDLPALAAHLYPFLPVRLFVRDRFDNAAALNAFHGPVAILMAERDEIIPAAHTQRLFEHARPPKRLWVFPAAGHNSWPSSPGLRWWEEVMAFVAPPHAEADH